MRNSRRTSGWRARFARTGERFNLIPRGLPLLAILAVTFTVYHISRVDSAERQTVARAKQEAGPPPIAAPTAAEPGSAWQAVRTTTQTQDRRSARARSDAAAPGPDAGKTKASPVDDARAYVYTARVGEYWSLIAAKFDLPPDLLKQANVELLRLRGEEIQPGDQLAIPGLSADAMIPPIFYTVGASDSWDGIAEAFSVSYLDLLLDNFELWTERGIGLRAGDEIKISYLPPEIAAASPGRANVPHSLAPAYAARTHHKDEEDANAAGAYAVQPGDTWESVAAAAGIDAQALKEVNRGLSARALRPGDVLRISWILHVSLVVRKAERRGARSVSDLNALSDEERAALAARGLTVYKEQYCGICHKLDSAGTKGIFGPPHNELGDLAVARLDDPAYQGEATDVYTYLYESIVAPDVYYVEGFALSPHRMPSYRHIPEDDLDALVAFLAEQ